MAVTTPTTEKYAKLWTKDWKQVYTFDETDVNFKHPYQLYLNTYTQDVYLWKGWRQLNEGYNFYVYEWANYREWTEDDGLAVQISNKVIVQGWSED